MKIWYVLLIISIVYRMIRMSPSQILGFLAVCLVYFGIVFAWEGTEKLVRHIRAK